jgi:ubiquinone/menaquinone biosynthesis C-methylase UbiE
VARGDGIDLANSPRLDVLLRNESDMAYRRRVRRMVAYLELAPGLTLLDCGTGMGFYLKVVTDLCPGCRLYGIDMDDKVLAYAWGHLRERGTVLARGDIHHLPFGDASMDRVLMSEVLEHLEDDAAALQEVYRVLKPGGILAVTVPHARYSAWYDPISRIHEALVGRPIRTGPFAGIWANHRRLYDAPQLGAVVSRAGFAIERVEELTHYCFPGTQTIVYTVGKGLIEHGLLPGFVARSTHRFHGEENTSSRLNPFNWVLALFDRIDRLNEDEERMARVNTYANVALKARKPE